MAEFQWDLWFYSVTVCQNNTSYKRKNSSFGTATRLHEHRQSQSTCVIKYHRPNIMAEFQWVLWFYSVTLCQNNTSHKRKNSSLGTVTRLWHGLRKDNLKYENDQQDATVWDNLLFLGCCTCFERYFRSSSGASKLYYSFWYYTRMSLPAGSDIRV